jgi:hypothetical protein
MAMARPCEVVKLHESPSGAQAVVDRVAACGGWASDCLPFAGIVSLGGSMGAYEDADYAWMPVEKRILRDAVTSGTCLPFRLYTSMLVSGVGCDQAYLSWGFVWEPKCLRPPLVAPCFCPASRKWATPPYILTILVRVQNYRGYCKLRLSRLAVQNCEMCHVLLVVVRLTMCVCSQWKACQVGLGSSVLSTKTRSRCRLVPPCWQSRICTLRCRLPLSSLFASLLQFLPLISHRFSRLARR